MAAMFDPDRAMKTIRRLDFPRQCGSEGEARARRVITDELRSIGIEPTCECFEDGWLEVRDAHLIVGPTNVAVKPAVPLPWLSPRPQRAKASAKVSGRLTLLEQTRDACRCAFIAVAREFDPSSANPPGASGQVLLFDPAPEFAAYCLATEEPVPAAYLPRKHQDAVLAALREEATLAWDAERLRRRFCNLVAEVRGATRPDELIVIGAHLDTWPGTVGSSDDAAGCTVLLEAARWFAAHPPGRTVRLVWFTGEEVDQRGSRHHVERRGFDADAVKLYVNVDGGFEQKSRSEPYLIVSSQAVADWVASWVAEPSPQEARISAPRASDARAFGANGIPVFWATGRSRQNPHLPTDRPETIDMRRLVLIGRVSIQAAMRAANDTPPPRDPRQEVT